MANRFQAYLTERQPFGDAVDLPFVDHAVIDSGLPDATSWEELEAYLTERNAPENTLRAAAHVWRLYLEER